jgi:DNA polymerase I-like protein with 3'-5' exonuclease and polymerase domains
MLTVNNPKTFDWANMALSDCVEGNAADAYFTLKIFDLISEKLSEMGMDKILEKLIMPALPMFVAMEYKGMDVSEKQLKVVGKQLRDANITEEDGLYAFDEVKTSDNLSSNNDLIEILYTREGAFEMYPPDRTGKGAPSVSAPTLKLLLAQIEEELEKRG